VLLDETHLDSGFADMTDNPKGAAAWHIDPVTYLESRPPEFSVATPKSLYLTMPDGVRIALDYYVPVGLQSESTFPTILLLTPYYRRFALREGARPGVEACPNAALFRDMFVPRGYALVVVDVRGTGASFGARDSFRSPAEREDYRVIMDWVVGQDWCDGRLGATGISYVGAACDFAASTGHPALKAIAPISAVWDTYADHFYPGGILLTHLTSGYSEIMQALDHDDRDLLKKFSYFADPDLAGPAPVDNDTDGNLVREAVHGHLANVHMPDFMREFQFRDEALAHDPAFTTDSFSPHAYSKGMRSDLAVLAISGWMDGAYSNGSISRFLSMSRNPDRYLLIGPWDHGARVNVSPFRATAVPEFPVRGEVLRFFDEHVRGVNAGLAQEARVHFHTMRAETWQSATDWPPTDRTETLYLSADGALGDDPGEHATVDYKVDYACGTGNETRYGRLQVRNVQEYYADWPEQRHGRAEFVSEPLSQSMTIAGHPIVTLHLASDQKDACVFVYLEDRAPDGTIRYITEGMLRALHRDLAPPTETYVTAWPYRDFTRARARPLAPGEMTELTFAMLPTSWQVPAGHCIVLTIAGADRDNFALWPYGRPGRWQISMGGPVASRVMLPVL
jgi:uncharacterized protein